MANILIEKGTLQEIANIICDKLNISAEIFNTRNDYSINILGFSLGLTFDENSKINPEIMPFIFSIDPLYSEIEEETVIRLCNYLQNILETAGISCFVDAWKSILTFFTKYSSYFLSSKLSIYIEPISHVN